MNGDLAGLLLPVAVHAIFSATLNDTLRLFSSDENSASSANTR